MPQRHLGSFVEQILRIDTTWQLGEDHQQLPLATLLSEVLSVRSIDISLLLSEDIYH